MKPFFPEMKLFSNEFKFPESADFYVGAALGLADIREHFDLNVTDLANGKIEYEITQNPREKAATMALINCIWQLKSPAIVILEIRASEEGLERRLSISIFL